MFQNPRRNSFENRQSCNESPIVISSLTPYVPSTTSGSDAKYDNQYTKLKAEFRTASQTRQNTATLTNNYSPIAKKAKPLSRKRIVFPEYEAQKQCLYVRPKGLLQVDPSRFQITPSELTMLRGKHHVQLSQVDVSTATGEVRTLPTPASLTLSGSTSSPVGDLDTRSEIRRTRSSYSVQLPSNSPGFMDTITPRSGMHDSLTEPDAHDLQSVGSGSHADSAAYSVACSGHSRASSAATRQRKEFVIPLPGPVVPSVPKHINTKYNKTA